MKTKIDPILKRKRRIVVTKINKNLKKNMKRLTFSHEDLYDFPESEVGGYVKLIFADKNDLSKKFFKTLYCKKFSKELVRN